MQVRYLSDNVYGQINSLIQGKVYEMSKEHYYLQHLDIPALSEHFDMGQSKKMFEEQRANLSLDTLSFVDSHTRQILELGAYGGIQVEDIDLQVIREWLYMKEAELVFLYNQDK